jgi:pimeloyl-ACP methyl ester carboxylesterase
MEKFIDLSTGVRMQYVEQGDTDGLPVVFLHGVTDSWHTFEQVLPLLPPSLHAFALSARGHGDSSRPDRGYLLSDMARDLGAFLDAKGLEQAVIAGHSMGSMVAQRFAVDRPDRVSALLLMGAFATLYHDPGLTDYYRSSIAPLTDPIDPGFAREWQLSTLAQPMPEDHLDTVVAETLKVPARVWHETFSGFLETRDFSAELARVTAPALLQWGDRDTYTGRAAQDRLLSVLPDAKLLVYEGNGHAIHWENAAQVTGDVLSFLASRVNGRVAA